MSSACHLEYFHINRVTLESRIRLFIIRHLYIDHLVAVQKGNSENRRRKEVNPHANTQGIKERGARRIHTRCTSEAGREDRGQTASLRKSRLEVRTIRHSRN